MSGLQDYTISIDDTLSAEEVANLRATSGSDADLTECQKCIRQNIINISERDASGKVIGVDLLTRNALYAELTGVNNHK